MSALRQHLERQKLSQGMANQGAAPKKALDDSAFQVPAMQDFNANGGEIMAQLKKKWAVVLVAVNAALAVITQAITGNVDITIALVMMAVISGLGAAIHYEENPSAAS